MTKPSRIETLKKRFEDAKLQAKLFVKEKDLLFENAEPYNEKKHLIVAIPEEREFRNIIIADDKELPLVIASKIEKYRFVKGYEAVWSQELKIIECEIAGNDILLMPPRYLLRRFKDLLEVVATNNDADEEEVSYSFPSPQEDIKIFIGTSSIDFSILQNFQRELFSLSGRIRKRITFRVEGKELKSHIEALDFLLKIANTVLFQIDLALNVPIHLVMDRQIMREMKMRKHKFDRPEFQPPKYEYDKEPLALYWYARTSTNMPLLQFLSFYQVMEFYFPLYSFTEARQRIKNFVKNPLFDITKDTDISQIINIIKVSAKGKVIGDEKSQIKATLQHIVDKDSLLSFYNENEDRKDFFDQQKRIKGLSKQKINFNSTDTDIRLETALRVYEIRCKIVHTKEEDDSELILPYSSEIKNLKHDLELVEFLAKQAIIAGARPLIL